MPIVEENDRKFPLKRPPGHKVPVPRWTLKLPQEVTHIYTLYVGVQSHEDDKSTAKKAERSVQEWLDRPEGQPAGVDVLQVTNGFDVVDSTVWIAYFTDADGFTSKLKELDLLKLWSSLENGKSSVGVWCEHFITPRERLETNYAGQEHKPGIAQVPNSEFPAHDLTAYWGAGRDRVPASKNDRFEPPANTEGPEIQPKGFGEHLTGSNYDNMCHIRSGQWWVKCPPDELEAYEGEGGLQKTLMTGMQYLWEHPEETGTIGLRFLQNIDDDGQPIRETCGAGFHRNWADLEKWSSKHPSHLAIFKGSMLHAKRFPNKRFMTWHEVSMLKKGEAKFEYVNCDPRTGVVRWVPLQREELSMS